jgi:hypothetical protein
VERRAKVNGSFTERNVTRNLRVAAWKRLPHAVREEVAVTTLLERVAHPLRELRHWGEHVMEERAAHHAEEEAADRQRHAAYVQELVSQYAGAAQLAPRPYRELSAGEVRYGNAIAFEYFQSTGELRLYNILPADLLSRAALTEALAMRTDVEDADVIDVKPHEIPPFEYGAINLTAQELVFASGTAWRLFITLTYSAAQGSFRGGIQTRRYIVDVTL